MGKIKRDDADITVEEGKTILHINGRRVEVDLIDYDPRKECFVFHHPNGDISRAYFGDTPPPDWKSPV